MTCLPQSSVLTKRTIKSLIMQSDNAGSGTLCVSFPFFLSSVRPPPPLPPPPLQQPAGQSEDLCLRDEAEAFSFFSQKVCNSKVSHFKLRVFPSLLTSLKRGCLASNPSSARGSKTSPVHHTPDQKIPTRYGKGILSSIQKKLLRTDSDFPSVPHWDRGTYD